LGNSVPGRDHSRREDRRFIPQDSHQVLLVRLYVQGNYVRTLPDAFSAVGAEEFVRCYNRLGANSHRSAKICASEINL
jgi:hypothetical protein